MGYRAVNGGTREGWERWAEFQGRLMEGGRWEGYEARCKELKKGFGRLVGRFMAMDEFGYNWGGNRPGELGVDVGVGVTGVAPALPPMKRGRGRPRKADGELKHPRRVKASPAVEVQVQDVPALGMQVVDEVVHDVPSLESVAAASLPSSQNLNPYQRLTVAAIERRCKPTEAVRWAMAHATFPVEMIDPGSVPSPEAASHLYAIQKCGAYSEFIRGPYAKILAKYLENEVEARAQEGDEDVLVLIKQFRRANAEEQRRIEDMAP